MKVRISIPGAYTAMEFEEGKGIEVFRKLNEVLLGIRGREAVPQKKPSGAAEPTAEEPESVLTEPEPVRMKYRGFMYIKCPSCGAEKGFHMRQKSDHYHCDSCGTRSVFEDLLVPLLVNCECGRRSRYMTNKKDPMFDITCLDCGSPVAVSWNEKKQLYEPIR